MSRAPRIAVVGSANIDLVTFADKTPQAGETIFGQGFDMGRPSVLQACAEKKDGKVVATYIGGHCKPMMSGVIELD